VLKCEVKSWEKGLLFIDDQFIRLLESGVHFFWDVDRAASSFLAEQERIEIIKTDLRQQQIDISGQEIMTADKTPLRVNFFCRYRVVDIMKTILSIKDLREQFYTALQIALREYLGSLTFDALMEKRRSIATEMSETLREVCAGFGLEFIGAGIKDVILPGKIREIMNQVLIAEKKAQANVIMRREETASTRSLLNTAKLMEENTILARLKEMEYIERIALNIKEISLSGKFQVFDELRTLFTPKSGG
jgi:regulator of protease activity HflC (stomatin/prohibitin superfamily)